MAHYAFGLISLVLLAIVATDCSSSGNSGDPGAGASSGAPGSGGQLGEAGAEEPGAGGGNASAGAEDPGAGAGNPGAGAGTVGGGGEGGGPSEGCVVDLVAGSYNTCALISDRTVWCWGGGQSTPTPVAGLEDVVTIASGTFHTCALKVDGTLWCWGANSAGQLGDGTTEPKPNPVQVLLPGGDEIFLDVSAAGFSTCARAQGGAGYCWGANSDGQVGDGTTESPQTQPVLVTVADTNAPLIPAGGHTCVRNADSALSCWGRNQEGELGDGSMDPARKLSPSPVAELGATVVRSTGRCAIKQDLSLWCWGLNSSGQVGDGTTDLRWSPARVTALGNEVAAVTPTMAKTCARKLDGTAWCWGRNDAGSLGDGELGGQPCPNGECKPTPVQVSGLTNVVAMAAGIAHACAAEGDSRIWCWGANHQGQLGDGTTAGETCGTGPACQPAPVETLFSCP